MRVTRSERWRTVRTSWSVTPPSNSSAVRRGESHVTRLRCFLALDPARIEEGQLVAVPNADQSTRMGMQDVLDALAEGRSRGHHLQGPDQTGLLPAFEL